MPVAWRRRTAELLRRAGYDVRLVGPGALLVWRHGRTTGMHAHPEWFEVEKNVSAFLADQHIAAVLDRYRVNVVVDVGANGGQYGLRLRRAGYRGRIASFEPVPETFEDLRRTAAADPLWSVYPCALGREDGVLEINVVPGTLSSALAPTSFGSRRYTRLREATRREVPVRRLDGLLDEIVAGVQQPRPYLKLDTQGFDLEAFAGLGERATEFVGMQSEVALLRIYEGMPRMPEAIATYEAAGFEITGLYPVSRQRRTGRVLEFDCVMGRAGAL